MNQQKAFFLAISLLISTICYAQQLEQKLQYVLDTTFQANQDSVGIMIHVESPNNNLSWTSAVDFSDKNTKENLQKDQPLLIASNTKTYVSASILKLVEQGKLKLNQPIKKQKNVYKRKGMF